MQKDEILKGLLNINDGVSCIVDLKNEKVEYLYAGNKLLFEETTCYQFSLEVGKFFNVTTTYDDSVLAAFRKLNSENETFELPVEYNLEDGNPINVSFKGSRIDENRVFLAVVSENKTVTKEIDSLTKCFTRPFMVNLCNKSIETKKPFALLLLDIDDFKAYNDTYGHMFGDMVLIEVVSVIKSFIGDRGYVSRIGGDEFLVYLDMEYSYDELYKNCKELIYAIRAISNSTLKDAKISTTIGAVAYPKDGESFELLFKKADKALYRGKGKGKKCFIIYTEEKCGVVLENEDLEVSVKKINESHKQNEFTCIRTVIETLNGYRSFEENITNALAVIGTFYQFERVSLVNTNPDTSMIRKQFIWYDHQLQEKTPLACRQEYVHLWREEMGEKRMLKISKFKVTEGFRMNDEFVADKSMSTLAFDLYYDDKVYGLLRFDTLTRYYTWLENDINALTLLARIFAIHMHRNYTSEKYFKELYFDKLTNTFNYNKWYFEVEKKINAKFEEFSVMDLSIANFRELGNIMGVKTCDDMLVALARCFESFEEKNVVYCRRSDDAFLLYVPGDDTKLMEEIYNHAMVELINNFQGYKNKIRLICGIYHESKNNSLSNAVDKAILVRNNIPKNVNIAYFDEEMYQKGKLKKELELHMNDALENNEFLLYLQPKINTKTGTIVGAEALTRWNYMHKEIIYPGVFIPLFEETGFITLLDYCVFENVCKFQREAIDNGLNVVPISVNVSRYVTDFNAYLSKLEEIRCKYSIPTELIEIEITEGMFFSNISEISCFIDNLHKLGYKISMDDFGSGYSNFASLANLNFDIIKLDKGFITDFTNAKENIIIKTITNLVKSLNMTILCEGVETKEFAEYLKNIGVDIIQGFFYDKPLPNDDFKKKYIK